MISFMYRMFPLVAVREWIQEEQRKEASSTKTSNSCKLYTSSPTALNFCLQIITIVHLTFLYFKKYCLHLIFSLVEGNILIVLT